MKKAAATQHSTVGLEKGGGERLEPILVEAISGPGRGAERVLEVGLLSVGRSPAADLVVHDESMSKNHLSVELLPGAVKVCDLGSRNGTYYQGARVKEATVPLGGTVRVGRTTLRFTPQAREAAQSARSELAGLTGLSRSMKRLFAVVEKVSASDATVLIQGESGVGKDRVAQAIHQLSPRASRPFVVFDCAAANPELVESQLFGHVKGAFTGAEKNHVGAFARANKGTLYLASAEELPLGLQPKLLRAVEVSEYWPLGAPEPVRGSVRVVAEAHGDLEARVRRGKFREDLFFRLAVAVVSVPPLRERLEDVQTLVLEFAREATGMELELSPVTLAALERDTWPGNVRELRNVVARTLALGTGSVVEDPLPVSTKYREARSRLLSRFEKDYLVALLSKTKGRVADAAKEAGLSRMQLYRLLKRHGLP